MEPAAARLVLASAASASRFGLRLHSLRLGGFGIYTRRKRKIRLVNILPADNRFPIFGQLSGNLITHDRLLIRGGPADRRFLDRRQDLRANFIFAPPLSLHKKLDRFGRIDSVDQGLAHMLMWKTKRMASFMADHAMVFRLDGLHGESFQIHRLLAFGNVQYIGTEIRPI